jgi:hypothetical protein
MNRLLIPLAADHLLSSGGHRPRMLLSRMIFGTTLRMFSTNPKHPLNANQYNIYD